MEERLNAKQVLKNVERLIAEGRSYKMDSVYRELSIFDWWVDNLSQTKLKDMRKFLTEAIKLGYTGYVCFKVGATGCANGMWAHKKESEDGYSPDGDCLYKSFTPAYNYWNIRVGDHWMPDDDNEMKYDDIKTIKDLEKFIAQLQEA